MRGLLRCLAFWLAALAIVPASAQTAYPDKPIRLIVGFTPGSATDITARIFAQKFSEAWGVPVTVENVPGAAGSIGAERGAKSPPDGYTLIYGANGALTINPTLQGSSATFDPVRDLTPISLVLTMPSILALNNDLAAKSLRDVIALAKERPGQLSYATPGVGTPQHVAGELLKGLAGVNIVHVPYRGAVFTDVIGGRVSMTLQNAGAILPAVRQGQLRAVAITAPQRSPLLPEVPTVAESGFPGFEASSWFSFAAPAGTPDYVVTKVHAAALAVLAQPEMRAKFAELGMESVGSSPAELAATLKADIAKWGKVIREAGIKGSE